MAYNDSGELPIGQSYQLGEYVFSITVSHDPGESETGINVRCDKGDERARVASEVTGTVESWSVEANETEASVYATLKPQEIKGGVTPPIASSTGTRVGSHVQGENTIVNTVTASEDVHWFCVVNGSTLTICAASASPESMPYVETINGNVTSQGTQSLSSRQTIQRKTVYYSISTANMSGWSDASYGCPLNSGTITATDAWLAVYQAEEADREKLVGRFAIDLSEAGGGPGGDWDEPGDTGDPRYTLNVNVTGASAGTHDAASVPSAPADQPVYGSGGAGGNGGGGGAGQSTVIVRRFATDKAGSVNQEVTLRPPGVGGKGGPGGRGGDGCILIFY